jgi:4-hydroxybenzoate polyprenyltransferase
MIPQSVVTLDFWRSYLITARPYLWCVSGTAGLVGLALAPPKSATSLTAAAAVFFVAYGFGQALTDTTQTDTDALSAPYRPLCRGVVTPRQIALVSLVGFSLCAVVLWLLNPWTLALAAAGVAGLATYTWFKRRWWAGPCYNACIVALLPVMGFLCGSPNTNRDMTSRLCWAASSVLFSYGVFVVLGYLKDVSADRLTGYVTLPVRFGWRTTLAISAVIATLALASSAALMASLHHVPLDARAWLARALWLAGAAAFVLAHALLLRTEREADAHRGIGWSVRGFVLLHLGEAASAMPALAGAAIAILLVFELGLALRPERSQI